MLASPARHRQTTKRVDGKDLCGWGQDKPQLEREQATLEHPTLLLNKVCCVCTSAEPSENRTFESADNFKLKPFAEQTAELWSMWLARNRPKKRGLGLGLRGRGGWKTDSSSTVSKIQLHSWRIGWQAFLNPLQTLALQTSGSSAQPHGSWRRKGRARFRGPEQWERVGMGELVQASLPLFLLFYLFSSSLSSTAECGRPRGTTVNLLPHILWLIFMHRHRPVGHS